MGNEQPVSSQRVAGEQPASSRIFHKITVEVEWDPTNGQWQGSYFVTDATRRTMTPGRGHFGRTRVPLGRFLQTRVQKIIGEYLVTTEDAPW